MPVFSLVSDSYHAAEWQPPHDHEDLQITVVLRGTVEERVGRSVERASALSVVVKDPGVMHSDHFGPSGAVAARLSLPHTTLAELVEHPGRALAWRWMHDPAVAIAFLRIVARAADGHRRFAADDEGILDLLAAISARYGAQAPVGVPRWLQDAVARIRDEWRPGLTVRDIARSAGVHPVYFARCVRRWYGVGAADLLRRSRLRHAARHVADGAPTIAQVAHATGFADESHLCREFSRTAGMPPARFRRLACAFGSSHNERDS